MNCARAKNGSRYCYEFSCKSDDACPSGTICHENSQEKYCSGITKFTHYKYEFIFIILKKIPEIALRCKSNNDCKKTSYGQALSVRTDFEKYYIFLILLYFFFNSTKKIFFCSQICKQNGRCKKEFSSCERDENCR